MCEILGNTFPSFSGLITSNLHLIRISLIMKTSSLAFDSLFSFFLGVLGDETVKRLGSPTVVIPSPDATFVGVSVGVAESLQGLPFAQPPVGPLRYNQPQSLNQNQSLGTINALARGPTCPQNLFDTNFADGLPQAALGVPLNTPLFQKAANINEDCLYLNVFRLAGIDASAKLPVLFWMHGGGFDMGFTMPDEGIPFVTDSIAQGKPIIFVAETYRVGGFGFLAGKEVLDAGVSNLGLLDQRQAMKWVADNIEAFGDDPDKVTIWGESAGAISVFDHLILYDDDNTYNGNPLFRAAIMNSGSVVPADPVDCDKAQWVYDHIVDKAKCSGASDTLQCLRDADYETLLSATTNIPTFTGYQSIALRYLPRPDGVVMTKSPGGQVRQGTDHHWR
jgi:carboxylesterase type B